MYAHDSNDWFPLLQDPVTKSVGAWPWDIPAYVANLLTANGAQRHVLYCPGFPKQDNNELWKFTTDSVTETTKNNTGYRVAGYQFAWKYAGRVRVTNITESLNPLPWKLAGGMSYNPGPSERVIIADANISQGSNEKDRTKNRYVKIDGGWKGHQSPHLGARSIPEGGSSLYADGHVSLEEVRSDGRANRWRSELLVVRSALSFVSPRLASPHADVFERRMVAGLALLRAVLAGGSAQDSESPPPLPGQRRTGSALAQPLRAGRISSPAPGRS